MAKQKAPPFGKGGKGKGGKPCMDCGKMPCKC